MFKLKNYVLLCWEKADNLDCRLFFFFFLGFGLGTSAQKMWNYYTLFVNIISGVLKIYTDFLTENLFVFWLWIFYMQAGRRPAKSIYSPFGHFSSKLGGEEDKYISRAFGRLHINIHSQNTNKFSIKKSVWIFKTLEIILTNRL